MPKETFRDLEHAGWVEKAEHYDHIFALITRQAIDPMLDSLGDLAGKRLLDVACGTGHLTAAATRRGADAEGIDFAATMVSKAADNYPGVGFSEGDAETLPYPNDCFDAVACSFGLLHLENPEKGVAEACRVIKNGGKYCFTVWCSPEQGGEFFNVVFSAVQTHGTLDVPLPPAPPMFRFADPEECASILTEAGFSDVRFSELPLTWNADTSQEALDMIYKSVVRAPMILQAQEESAREKIEQAIIDGVERYRESGQIKMAFPALMVVATKLG